MSKILNKCQEIANCFEFMPLSNGRNNQSELSSLFLKHPISESITFFGGTFNPFHKGHLACLNLCPEKNILIIPDFNPLKTPFLNSSNYCEYFLNLAHQLKETPYSIYPGFLAELKLNPTHTWIPYVKINEKNFLMGDDSFMELAKWSRPDIFVQSLTKLYVVPRNFTKKDRENQAKEVLKWNKKLKIIFLAEHSFQDISSTKLRKCT